ncbi:MAG: DNA polymerase III subunit chi [Alphaproteobacteria bacterium]|nr:DNA polymerase III subunit chi [Alphaproteobacteria bacterium]
MSRVDFYHLQNKRLEDVLPKLLEKVYAINKRAIVRIGNNERIEFLNSLLWTYDEQSFLPHGSKKDGAAEMQPIWLTSENDNPNRADFLFLTDGAEANIEEIQQYERVFNIFDGNSTESVEKARIFWRELKQQSVDIFYWQQNQSGAWEQKG